MRTPVRVQAAGLLVQVLVLQPAEHRRGEARVGLLQGVVEAHLLGRIEYSCAAPGTRVNSQKYAPLTTPPPAFSARFPERMEGSALLCAPLLRRRVARAKCVHRKGLEPKWLALKCWAEGQLDARRFSRRPRASWPPALPVRSTRTCSSEDNVFKTSNARERFSKSILDCSK